MKEPLTQDEEISSQLMGLNKTWDKTLKNKKLIIAIVCGIVLFSILLIIIILSLSNSDSKEEPKESDEPDKPHDPDDLVGEINCVYDIFITSNPIIILGQEFNKKNDFDILIDGQIIKYSRQYQFNSTGIHKIQFRLYEDINMDYMFKDVQSLYSVEMYSEKNCKILSMISTFENCYELEDFKIKGFSGSQIKSMQKLFYKSWLQTYSISMPDTHMLEDISYMFALTTIRDFSLKNLNTNNVKNMSHLLERCSSLISFDLTNINTTNVKDMSYMFSSVTGIQSLDLSAFDTKQVINMSHMFHDCNSLVSLFISNFDTNNVIDMSSMFDSCYSIKDLEVSNFITNNVKNMSGMFQFCNSLTSLNLKKFNTGNVETTSGLFHSCASITACFLPPIRSAHSLQSAQY